MEKEKRLFTAENDGMDDCIYKNLTGISDNFREITLTIDSKLEFASVYDNMFLMASARAKELLEAGTGDKDISYWQPEHHAERLTDNQKRLAFFQSRNTISVAPHTQNLYNFELDDKEPFPLINVLSGAQITLPCGEGILDFLYADFDKGYRSASDHIQPEHHLPAIEIQTDMERNIFEHVCFLRTMDCFGDLVYSSLCSAAFPPVMKERSKAALDLYFSGLKKLQMQLAGFLEFCFDEDCYPAVLGGKSPVSRFALYCRIHRISLMTRRSEVFEVDSYRAPHLPKYATPSDVIPEEYDEPKHSGFIKAYDIRSAEIQTILDYPSSVRSYYECGGLCDMLELECMQAIRLGIRFRKCKRCGRYFIMKGNYDTNYCDRIADGETRNCQELAAQENYKKKAADNAAIPIYSKYYKRYSARFKVKQIKEADFKKWKYAAIQKRDECSHGKLSVYDFIQWMESSFPNRQKKG